MRSKQTSVISTVGASLIASVSSLCSEVAVANCNVTMLLDRMNSAKASGASVASGANVTPSTSSAPAAFSGNEKRAIVGYWQVTSIFQGSIVDGRFDNWFEDHNELFIDQSPPATDNVCNGTWVRSGEGEYKLRHMAWVFDSTNTIVVGTIGIRDTVTLSTDEQTFSGTEIDTVYDLNGNVLGVFGPIELQGKRVKVDF